MTTEVRAALEAYGPQLEARFVSLVTAQIERLVAQFGSELRGIANSGQYKAYSAIAPYYDRATASVRSLRLAEGAREYAFATTQTWVDKIEAKVGQLESAKVAALSGCSFLITGQKAGRSVRIEQDMIVNVSPKGTLFNQFPARIYVDGKFTPAAAFAKM